MSERIYKVPFLCTGNSPHSILAEAAFITACRNLKPRTGIFTGLPLARIDRLSLGAKLRDIGREEGGTTLRPDVREPR